MTSAVRSRYAPVSSHGSSGARSIQPLRRVVPRDDEGRVTEKYGSQVGAGERGPKLGQGGQETNGVSRGSRSSTPKNKKNVVVSSEAKPSHQEVLSTSLSSTSSSSSSSSPFNTPCTPTPTTPKVFTAASTRRASATPRFLSGTKSMYPRLMYLSAGNDKFDSGLFHMNQETSRVARPAMGHVRKAPHNCDFPKKAEELKVPDKKMKTTGVERGKISEVFGFVVFLSFFFFVLAPFFQKPNCYLCEDLLVGSSHFLVSFISSVFSSRRYQT